MECIAPRVRSLALRIEEGVRARGFEVLGTPGAGIVSFRNPNEAAHVTVRKLKEKKMIAAPRQGWVRTSPHFYISPDDIDQMLASL